MLSFRERTRSDRTAPVPGSLEATFPERVVARVSDVLASRRSRRSFLARTAVVGSALAVNPLGYALKPGTAYAALCGTCSDGWTAFCCTVNGGSNTCPPDSFVAGWWKADNAAFCCGKARYIIDCNATCPTQCDCRCSGASCDGRRTCCNQFRYGQCNQQIACYGPVVCRVAICTPAWEYDPSCTTTSATDNRTVTHGAPCNPTDDCAKSPIAKLYDQFGGAGGILGPVRTTERATADGSGRYAHYENGSIFQRNGKAPFACYGSIGKKWAALQYHRGPLGYPVSNNAKVGDAANGTYSRFERGVIYQGPAGVHEVVGAIRDLHSSIGGVAGALGYPTTGNRIDAAGFPRQYFAGGAVYFTFATGARWMNVTMRERYRQLGEGSGPLGYPVGSIGTVGPGWVTRFQKGAMYARKGSGSAFFLTDRIYENYRTVAGEVRGPHGYPVSDAVPYLSGKRALFESGGIYQRGTVVAQIHGSLDDKYQELGAASGPLGWVRQNVATAADGRGRLSRCEFGTIYSEPGVGRWAVWGPIEDRYRQLGEVTGALGYPRSDVYADGNLSRCDFRNGRLTYDPGTGQVTQD